MCATWRNLWFMVDSVKRTWLNCLKGLHHKVVTRYSITRWFTVREYIRAPSGIRPVKDLGCWCAGVMTGSDWMTCTLHISELDCYHLGALVAVSDLQSGGCGFKSQSGLLRTKVCSAFHPSGVSKWVPVVAGKAKAGMAHSDCGWMCGCAGKTVKSLVWHPGISLPRLSWKLAVEWV